MITASPPTSSADLPATDLTPPKSASLSTETTSLPTSPQPRIGVLFGTHNWASCAGILGALEKSGLGYKESASSGEGEKAEGPLVLDREVTGRVTVSRTSFLPVMTHKCLHRVLLTQRTRTHELPP